MLCILIYITVLAGVLGDTGCPRGWIANDNSCYLFAHYPVPYHEAKSYCAQHGGGLVEVHNSAANHFLKDHIGQLKTRHWWIGLSDSSTEGAWQWESNRAATNFTDWYPGQPSAKNGEDCAYFAYNYAFKWADATCTSTSVAPICEQYGYSCSPAAEIIG